ncbi:MAG: ComEC/Rec2 family competence protein [Filifactoraceae bacterium]
MKKILLLIIIIFPLIFITACQEKSSISGEFQIHIIDVGQGDSTLLITPEGETILIDTGSYKNYDKLKAYLFGLGITKFNKLIATHPDSDHIGSMAEIIKDFDVDEFYMPDKTHPSTSFDLMVEELTKKSIPINISYANDKIQLSQSVEGIFLSPYNQFYKENNLYSLVLYIKYNDTTFLFMGDAEEENEYEILSQYPSLHADFIKLGHHGSKSSSSRTFIEHVSPYISVISVGKKNDFGHPHKEVVSLLEELKIPLYRTDEQESIVFLSNGKSVYSNKEHSGSYKSGNE